MSQSNEAVKRMIQSVLREAKKAGRKIGICGQAPSDYPEFAEFLVENGIDSLSLNPTAWWGSRHALRRSRRGRRASRNPSRKSSCSWTRRKNPASS